MHRASTHRRRLRIAAAAAAAVVSCSEAVAPDDEAQRIARVSTEVLTYVLPGEGVRVYASAYTASGERVVDATFNWVLSGPFQFTGSPAVVTLTGASPSPIILATGIGSGTIRVSANGITTTGSLIAPEPKASPATAHMLPGDSLSPRAYYSRGFYTECCGTLWTYPQIPVDSVRSGSELVTVRGPMVFALAPGSANVSVFAWNYPAAARVEILGEPDGWLALRAIVSGSYRPCGIAHPSGAISCWGGGVSSPWEPTSRGTTTTADLGPGFRTYTTSSFGFGCGLTEAGELRCTQYSMVTDYRWREFRLSGGRNPGPQGCGILADSTLACRYGTQLLRLETPRMISLELDGNVLCGVATDATPRCWSLAETASNPWATPLVPIGVPAVTAVSLGRGGICWVAVDRSAWCSGAGGYSNSSPAVLSNAAQRITGIPPAIGVAAGDTSFVLTADGAAWRWAPGTEPVPVPNATDLASIWIASRLATCGIRADNSVWCWGQNTDGSVGDGTALPRRGAMRVRAGY